MQITNTGNQATVQFNWDTDNKRAVVIDDPKDPFYLESIRREDEPEYQRLWTDKAAMSTYIDGNTFKPEEITDIVKKWSENYDMKDPYSGFVVRMKKTNEFMGNVTLGHDKGPTEKEDIAGSAEIGYILHEKFWHKGYMSKAVENLINVYAKTLIEKDYKLAGKSLETISAWIMHGNSASVRIVEKVGMHYVEQDTRYGVLMDKYVMSTDHLKKK